MKHPELSVQTPGKPAPSTTPPVTPTIDRSTRDIPDADSKDILRYSDEIEIHHDQNNQPVEFGRGVWSLVYKASSVPAFNPSLMTPPSSPAFGGRVVAVKSPVRRDAHAVLEAEARALTRLTLSPGSERHVIPFLGYIPRSHSLVMAAVPLSLSIHLEEQAAMAQKNRSTQTMFEPVLGMTQWLDLSKKLIAGLAWLHNEPRIVHGDIKPHNLLLRPIPGSSSSSTSSASDNKFPYEPLFADFSSAHDLAPTSFPINGATPSTTALTPPFAAPELLALSSLKSPDSAPTPASDVFSLAVTLLAAATGDLLLYPGTSHMQRLAMAREGHRVIEFARSGTNGVRVPRNGAVEVALRLAVCKEPAERVGSREWLELL